MPTYISRNTYNIHMYRTLPELKDKTLLFPGRPGTTVQFMSHFQPLTCWLLCGVAWWTLRPQDITPAPLSPPSHPCRLERSRAMGAGGREHFYINKWKIPGTTPTCAWQEWKDRRSAVEEETTGLLGVGDKLLQLLNSAECQLVYWGVIPLEELRQKASQDNNQGFQVFKLDIVLYWILFPERRVALPN